MLRSRAALLKGCAPGRARKPAWRMTRFDLANAGMPSETVEGIADFHAVGRGSFITNLARAGVPIHTVKELARHSSVTMTERYIGTSMQVSANAVDQPDWQCIGSESSGNDRHNVSPSGFEQPLEGRHKERQIPSKNRGFDIESPFFSAAVTEQANCERGESNPSFLLHNQLRDGELARVASETAVNGQCLPDSTCLTLSAIDSSATSNSLTIPGVSTRRSATCHQIRLKPKTPRHLWRKTTPQRCPKVLGKIGWGLPSPHALIAASIVTELSIGRRRRHRPGKNRRIRGRRLRRSRWLAHEPRRFGPSHHGLADRLRRAAPGHSLSCD